MLTVPPAFFSCCVERHEVSFLAFCASVWLTALLCFKCFSFSPFCIKSKGLKRFFSCSKVLGVIFCFSLNQVIFFVCTFLKKAQQKHLHQVKIVARVLCSCRSSEHSVGRSLVIQACRLVAGCSVTRSARLFKKIYTRAALKHIHFVQVRLHSQCV